MPQPFKAQYIFNIASNLYKFFNNALTDTEIKAKLKEVDIIKIGAPKAGKVKALTPALLLQYADKMLQEGVMSKEINGLTYSLTSIVGEITTRRNTGFTDASKQRYALLS